MYVRVCVYVERSEIEERRERREEEDKKLEEREEININYAIDWRSYV
jgi:hypothetical protein